MSRSSCVAWEGKISDFSSERVRHPEMKMARTKRTHNYSYYPILSCFAAVGTPRPQHIAAKHRMINRIIFDFLFRSSRDIRYLPGQICFLIIHTHCTTNSPYVKK